MIDFVVLVVSIVFVDVDDSLVVEVVLIPEFFRC